jgi:CRISPR-associated protein Csb1
METTILEKLYQSCQHGMAAVRAVVPLEPVDGASGKVFPPTYLQGPYAFENRRVDGQEVRTVLLDSVQSQANRLEELLLGAHRRGDIAFPLIEIDFGGGEQLTCLDLPHRVHDAILRDSEIKGKPFRETEIGKSLVGARAWKATAFYRYAPTALLFGTWDSTGGGGVNSAKVARSLVSEIIGLHAVDGVRTSSRIDPLGIKRSIELYKGPAGAWTLDKTDVEKDGKMKPGWAKQRPADINHGNIPPTIGPGGVTISGAVQTTVLSFIQLRKLQFPDGSAGSSPQRDVAGRTVLAALALYAVLLQWNEGYQLRSRCQLVPKSRPQFCWLGMTAGEIEPLELDLPTAKEVFANAVEKAEGAGLRWEVQPMILTPSESLRRLKEESDKRVAVGEED